MKLFQKGAGMLVAVLLLATGASAQVSKLRINEVMVNNQNNYTDAFGRRSPWIEVYNTYGATVNIGGCYLTDDRAHPTKYKIPKGDLNTKIGPRQFVVFWADNNPDLGTFHLNFKLDPSKDNYLGLFDNSGKVLIDEITIPATAAAVADKSFGRLEDGAPQWGQLASTTPKFVNKLQEGVSASQKLMEQDPTGLGMSITAMSVVFMALITLFIVFSTIAKLYMGMTARKAQRPADGAGAHSHGHAAKVSGEISGEVCAAIALALQLYQSDQHDHEETVLTIAETQRRYSPWSSKIHTLRQIPQVKPTK